MNPVYLDYNATTPIDPEVAEAMLPFLYNGFGNPSSGHSFGVRAREVVDAARLSVADLLGCNPSEVVFTGGGSESNNMVLWGIARLLSDNGRHIITTAVEHPAVLEPCAALERDGFEITIVGVDGLGRVDTAAIEAVLRPDTILVSVMHANNEVGTIQPVPEIAAVARAKGVLCHTDAAQSVGKIPVDVNELGVDFLSVAGHKLYAPKGIGALFVRSGHDLPPLIHGAGHESGRRAGTENVLEIVGLGKACEIAARELSASAGHMAEMRDLLWERLSRELHGLGRNGDPENGLPNTLSVALPGVRADKLLDEIGDEVAASAGSACHAGDVSVSPVLAAMAVPRDGALGTIRFSVGRATTAAEIERAAAAVVDAVRRQAER